MKKYVFKKEKTRGGTAYKIKLSSLEEVYQIKYIKDIDYLVIP